MKYIRKAKNTQMAGKLPDDYITETVDQDKFTAEHEAMGGWELVEDDLAEQLVQATMQTNTKQLSEEQRLTAIDMFRSKIQEKKQLKEEFEAFKAWKASQVTP